MPRHPRPAVVTLRMSRELREALHVAASDAGCSLNSYAIQLLASAAGDPARFKKAERPKTVDSERQELQRLPRDERGYPIGMKDRIEHVAARTAFVEKVLDELEPGQSTMWIYDIDKEDPSLFVEWKRGLRDNPVRAGPESGDLRGAA
jgi:hypothetical protein